MGSLANNAFHVRNIAIIGAGPCGLVAAKYLRAQNVFDKIVIFEQQDQVGGIWNFSRQASTTRPVPQEDAFFPPDEPLRSEDQHGRAPIFPSPLYDRLYTNIQSSLMKFTDQDFPREALIFPHRQTVQDYLLQYAEDVRSLISFCWRVNKITLQPDGEGNDRWLLDASSTLDGATTQSVFDAVVVSNGHYAVPYIPAIRNIDHLHQAHPDVIMHSKHFREATQYRDMKVIVVGNGPSGTDIAGQISQVSKHKPLLSVRQATPPAKLANTGAEEVAEIEEFLPDERGVRFKDGRVEHGIDAVIFCTGFLYSYPFLPDLQKQLISTGKAVRGLYQHLFHIRHPTLVFPGLNMKAVPWPVSEAQAAVFSAVWANRLPLPSVGVMESWDRKMHDERGEGLHVFRPLEDAVYLNEMHDWAMKASQVMKQPPYWGERLFWERKVFTEARIRFEQMGFQATSLEELGFQYDEAGEEEYLEDGP